MLMGIFWSFSAIFMVLPGLAQEQLVTEPIPSSVPVGVSAGEETTFHPEAAASGISSTDWEGIGKAYEAERHGIKSVEGKVNVFKAWNPRQRWVTHFDGRGFTIRPRGEAGWQWGLSLQSYGWGELEYQVSNDPLKIENEGQDLRYVWDSVMTEWFVNDRRGLEHGFTVWEKSSGEGSLHVVLQVHGRLQPVVASSRKSVSFCSRKTNACILTYDKLKVWDGTGRVLESHFEAHGEDGIRLIVDDEGARYPLTIDPIAQQVYLKASNSGEGDSFGFSVAVSGDTVVVGARNEDSVATGIDGDGSNNSALRAGAAYVFVRSGSGWTQQAYLKASNTDVEDIFGESVAIYGDTVVVGASGEKSAATGVDGSQTDNSFFGAGAAYVFVRSGNSWSQQAYLKASNTGVRDGFGASVAISGDTVVVGASEEDSAATGVDGIEDDNTVANAGAAYVFVRKGGSWAQQAYLKASNTGAFDHFGSAVAISGETVVVGAIFERSAVTGVNGNQADNSVLGAGAAYVFVRDGETWEQQAYLKASHTGDNDQFGSAVAISDDTLVVAAKREESAATGINGAADDNSAFDAGAVYVFVRIGGGWEQEAYLKASNTEAEDHFGSSVAISGDSIVVSAASESSAATGVNGSQGENSASKAGAAYVFVWNGNGWIQQAYLKASNPEAFDYFGYSVAVSGDTVVVGAIGESSSANEIGGSQGNDAAPDAGAAYVFSGLGRGAPGGGVVVSPRLTIGGIVNRTSSIGAGTKRVFIIGKPDFAGGIGNNWPANEGPENATDQILGDSFFTHNSNTGLGTVGTNHSALVVAPGGGSGVVNQLTFHTEGNPLDADPSNYTIYGMSVAPNNLTPGTQYHLDAATFLGSGPIELPSGGRGIATVRFENNKDYPAYVIYFQTVRGPFTGVMRLAELSLERSGPIWNNPAIIVDSNKVSLSITGVPGVTYKVQRSPDLRTDSWTTLFNAIGIGLGDKGVVIEAFDENPLPGKSFYRIVE